MQNFKMQNFHNSIFYYLRFSWIAKKTNKFYHLKHLNYFRYKSIYCLTNQNYSTKIGCLNKSSKFLDRYKGKPYFTISRFFSSEKTDTEQRLENKYQTVVSYFPIYLEKFKDKKGLLRLKVFPWSISGIESCIVISCPKFSIAFDIGYAFRSSIYCKHVFISHGHIDHIAGLYHHASKRQLYHLPKATYYVPPHLVDPLKSLGPLYTKITDQSNIDFDNLNIVPALPHEKIQINKFTYVVPFPTIHNGPSQGYVVYGVEQNKEGLISVPLVAYTGDTCFEVFKNPPNPDILTCQLLMTEATYLDEFEKFKPKAEKFRHIHLQDILDNFDLFHNVKYLYLMHISDRYTVQFLKTMKLGKSFDMSSNCKILFSAQAKYVNNIF